MTSRVNNFVAIFVLNLFNLSADNLASTRSQILLTAPWKRVKKTILISASDMTDWNMNNALITNLVFVVIKLLLKGSILLVGLGLTKINTTLNRWDKMNKNTENKKLAWSEIV